MTRATHTEPLNFDDIDDVILALRRQGSRLSTPRRLVLEALFAARRPVSAEYIAGGSGGERAALELSSVYRSLERLEELGVVTHMHLGHGPGLYALTGRGRQEHLVCERCGTVTTAEPERLDGVRSLIRREFGYEASFAHFPVVGLCPACADPAKTSNQAH